MTGRPFRRGASKRAGTEPCNQGRCSRAVEQSLKVLGYTKT